MDAEHADWLAAGLRFYALHPRPVPASRAAAATPNLSACSACSCLHRRENLLAHPPTARCGDGSPAAPAPGQTRCRAEQSTSCRAVTRALARCRGPRGRFRGGITVGGHSGRPAAKPLVSEWPNTHIIRHADTDPSARPRPQPPTPSRHAPPSCPDRAGHALPAGRGRVG